MKATNLSDSCDVLHGMSHLGYVPRYLSKYTTKNFQMEGLRTSFMRCMKVLGVLDKPKGVIGHSYNLYLLLKAIFHSSPSFILI